jgi:transcriptional regulator with XRE-family HTH domain
MGERIREARKKSNLTQEQLAEKLDVSFTYVSELERNLKMPSMQLFIKLIETLDVSADELLQDSVAVRRTYGDPQIDRKLKSLTPKQRAALDALIDTYLEYLD